MRTVNGNENENENGLMYERLEPELMQFRTGDGNDDSTFDFGWLAEFSNFATLRYKIRWITARWWWCWQASPENKQKKNIENPKQRKSNPPIDAQTFVLFFFLFPS